MNMAIKINKNKYYFAVVIFGCSILPPQLCFTKAGKHIQKPCLQ